MGLSSLVASQVDNHRSLGAGRNVVAGTSTPAALVPPRLVPGWVHAETIRVSADPFLLRTPRGLDEGRRLGLVVRE